MRGRKVVSSYLVGVCLVRGLWVWLARWVGVVGWWRGVSGWVQGCASLPFVVVAVSCDGVPLSSFK